ncbi:hypothetical protein CRYUN_Cryun16bG0017500 [Craigia yunnanensis]
MSVAVLDSKKVTGFVEQYFKMLDSNGNEGVSCNELEEHLRRIFTMELESKSKDRFDEDDNNKIDRNEFTSIMREIMLAMARGIGNLPVIVALFQDSLQMMAIKHELAHKHDERIL